MESSTLQSGATTYTIRWIPSPGSRVQRGTQSNQTEHAWCSDNDGEYSRSGFYFLPSWYSWARAFERPISSGRPLPRVCRFIASRSIRDNCCWSVSDVCTVCDTKSFFPHPRVYPRSWFGHAAAYPVRLFYYVRNFSAGFPCARASTDIHAHIHMYKYIVHTIIGVRLNELVL